ncbi:hypothetical protein V8G54_031349 [Vigna mungo]|uniref:Phosphatidic acid phosphatase type 2/haloperoxidase domain-containing protein n=1 Tax=Vigna mungo TaxID=3915 RepID=A0AAQ3RL01_VIGMU
MCDSHGWPSSHCQYMFFFATYLTILTFWHVRDNPFLHLLTWSLSLLTMYSRVYLNYHIVAQVLAGTVLGVFLGAVWLWVVNSVLHPYFPLIEESTFGRRLYVKDTSHISNVLKFEYDMARTERRKLASNFKED